ncbi:hypothetical protein [Glycomyces tenuis]|uniref:hypothetical protein n=1 Tax=Glycomyces tenuis TaxID=58116 RepID=UPI0012DC1F4D|nr:hypothetical protein [Glycomyces tenuis]
MSPLPETEASKSPGPPTTKRALVGAFADLRGGRNAELYVTVTIALSIAILGILNVANPDVVAAATLAVLALLATSRLADRHQSRDISRQLDELLEAGSGPAPADRFFTPGHTSLGQEMSAATEIWLVGVTLTRTIRDSLPMLDRRLQAGASVRVLLLDVDSTAETEAVARSKKAHAPDFYRHRTAASIDLLRVLAGSARSATNLQLRLLPFVPTFGLCLLDASDEHGRIHVEIYQHRTLEANPSFSLHAQRDSRWYHLFADQFDTLWDSARPHPLSD